MKSNFEGLMAVFVCSVCAKSRIYEKYSPSPGYNLHHWELFGDKELSSLSDEQIGTIIDEAEFL